MRRSFVYKVVTTLLVVAVAMNGLAQGPTLSKRAASVKRKVGSLPPNSSITLIRIHGGEGFGELLSSDEEGFTFRDVDTKAVVRLNYIDVRKIKKGYGGYNSVQARHTDRTRNIVVAIVVVGGLGALIGAAAAAKN